MSLALRTQAELDGYIAYFQKHGKLRPLISNNKVLQSPLTTVQQHFELTDCSITVVRSPLPKAAGTIQQIAHKVYCLTIDTKYKQNSTEGIICAHEMSHVWMDLYMDKSRKDYPDTRSRERLTDVVAILSGCGILCISAYKEEETRISGMGYLSISERAYVLARYETLIGHRVDSSLIHHELGRTRLSQARQLCASRHSLVSRTLRYLQFQCSNAGKFRVAFTTKKLRITCPFCKDKLHFKGTLWTMPNLENSFVLEALSPKK